MLLLTPNGNQYTLSAAPDGTFLNGTIPALRGNVLTPNRAAGVYTLRQPDGTVYTFQTFPSQGPFGAYLTSITDLNGNTTTLTLNPDQPLQVLSITDPVGRSMNLTYDNSNRINQITDPIGRKVKYSYNGQGTLEKFTDANGGVTSYTYDLGETGTNVATITDPRGIVTESNSYNEGGDQRITQQVDANGGVTKFAYRLLNPAAALLNITTNGYSPVLQTVVTDPLGHQTTYRFNTAGFLQSATDPSGQTTTLTHDAAHNNLITAYQGAGVCLICGNRTNGDTSYTYDQFGNQLTQTDALGHTTSYAYDLRFNKINSIADPLGSLTKLSYDSNGNLLNITDANGHQTQLAYDAFGEVTQVTDVVGAKTVVSYDSFGNITSVTDALGNKTTLSYDAISRLTQVADALGRKITATYDDLDRITSQTDPTGSTTSFAYDAIGNLLSFTDGRNNAVRFAYDSIGRLQTRTSQLGKVDSYQYDANSNPIQYTDRRGQVSKFQYDVNNRLVQETYIDATVTRSYDAKGRLTAVNDSQGGTFGFSYDATGQLLNQDEPTGTVRYTRDLLGRVATRQVFGQGVVSYSYDPVGNMLSAALPAAGVTYQYDARNLPQRLSRTNGVVTNYSFDQLGQVLSIIHTNGAGSLDTETYAYDAAGNRSAIDNDISQSLITQSATSTVNVGNELLTSGQMTYTYDDNGNRLTETGLNGQLTYSWDGRNRLAVIRDSQGNITKLGYDFNRSLLSIDRTTPTSASSQDFVVDGLTNVVATTDSSGLPISILTGRSIDSHYASVDTSGTDVFGLFANVGSLVGITGPTGALLSTFDYEPYGLTSGQPDRSYPFAFTGRVLIANNIYYYRNRFYDANNGRFLSEDPLGVVGGSANLYQYADNNPINKLDPLGLIAAPSPCDYIGGAVGLAAAAIVDKVFESGVTYLFTGLGIGIGGLLAPPFGEIGGGLVGNLLGRRIGALLGKWPATAAGFYAEHYATELCKEIGKACPTQPGNQNSTPGISPKPTNNRNRLGPAPIAI